MSFFLGKREGEEGGTVGIEKDLLTSGPQRTPDASIFHDQK